MFHSPDKLRCGDEVRVVSPALSVSHFDPDHIQLSCRHLEELGYTVSFGAHAYEMNRWESSSIEDRAADLHAAFLDPSVKAILCTTGGYNGIELLRSLDFKLIAANPKIICGFSDNTLLLAAIFAHTGMKTFHGPQFVSFGFRETLKYTALMFQKAVQQSDSFYLENSEEYIDSPWKDLTLTPSPSPKILNPGIAEGFAVAGNLYILNLLSGSSFMPDLRGSILFIEEEESVSLPMFCRDLEALILRPDFHEVQALVIGRFQHGSKVMLEDLRERLIPHPSLQKIPIVTDVAFGHTLPTGTIPLGGEVVVDAGGSEPCIEFRSH